MKAQAKVKNNGKHTFIDKVSVRLVASDDKYWATLVNFGYKYVHIADREIDKYDRLVQGGIWAEIDLEYLYEEEGRGTNSPFRIRELKPIQIATFDFNEYIEGRKHFTTDEWIDFLILTIGLEPTKFSKRNKLLYLSRLIPLVENNDCYWLTTHCKGDTKHTLEYLSDKLPTELMPYIKKIKPTNWQTLKTEAIDFAKDFRWYDDYIMEAERDVLVKNNCANKFIKK